MNLPSVLEAPVVIVVVFVIYTFHASQVWITLFQDPGGVIVSLSSVDSGRAVYDSITFGAAGGRQLGIMTSNSLGSISQASIPLPELTFGVPLHLVLSVNQVTGVRSLYRNGALRAQLTVVSPPMYSSSPLVCIELFAVPHACPPLQTARCAPLCA